MANCTINTFGCWAVSNADVLANIAKTMKPVQLMLSGAAYLIGLMFAVKALYALKVYGEARTMMSSNTSMKEPLGYLLVAAMLIYIPTGFEILMNSTFGYSSVLAYLPVNSGNPTLDAIWGSGSPVGASLAIIIQTIGLIAFIRGWVLIARSSSQGQQPGGMGKGFIHVFGGILGMNIVGTLQIINNTLYGS